MADACDARAVLRAAVRQLSDRGLKCSAKWAAEQLDGLPASPPSSDREMGEPSSADAPMEPDAALAGEDEEDRVLLAKERTPRTHARIIGTRASTDTDAPTHRLGTDALPSGHQGAPPAHRATSPPDSPPDSHTGVLRLQRVQAGGARAARRQGLARRLPPPLCTLPRGGEAAGGGGGGGGRR